GEWEPKPLIVGFAAETEDLLANAHEKMGAKHMDMIVANDVTATDAGFGSDTNRVAIVDATGGVQELELMSKDAVASRVLDRVQELLGAGQTRQTNE
ncbi:MAG TPA: phosphopantothenoylcysteine decarboxylase, partial [Armatimonadota bacterium]|nr:phosphopantothenoylcysteine decarboxylase [Armatimonadota bacterium]